MAIPDHVFSRQDYLDLGDDDNENLREIERFHPQDGKLSLILRKGFKEDNFLALSEALLLAFDKWKLKDFW